MKHSQRDSERAEQDLAHLRRLRPDTGAGGNAGAGGGAANGGGTNPDAAVGGAGPGVPAAREPEAPASTGRAGGDPAAGAGNDGRPRYAQDPHAAPDGSPAAPVASDAPPGAVIGPGGPLAEDLPEPPAMQYPPGSSGIGPGRRQHPPEVFEGAGMPGGATTLAPTRAATAAAPVNGEWVTCPECGQAAMIDPAQRRAEDFCTRCDFPLFWSRGAVVPLSTDETGASLRRLPGTVGRAATASVACPHCGEPNSPIAIICIRCSQPMVIPEPEPEPEPVPVYVPPPEPEPEKGFPLWWVVGACVALVIITIIVAWVALAV